MKGRIPKSHSAEFQKRVEGFIRNDLNASQEESV